jgi:hypothetical protein
MIGFLLIGFCGCTNVRHQAKFNENYTLNENVSIKVEKVVNDTGFIFDIDIEEMLADALEDQLPEEDLLWLGGNDPVLKMETRIIEYEKGKIKGNQLKGRIKSTYMYFDDFPCISMKSQLYDSRLISVVFGFDVFSSTPRCCGCGFL